MSQMATTAPRCEGEDYNSGGRITAEVRKVIDGKHNMADQVITPALFAKKNMKISTMNQTAPNNPFQKRSASVYQNPTS